MTYFGLNPQREFKTISAFRDSRRLLITLIALLRLRSSRVIELSFPNSFTWIVDFFFESFVKLSVVMNESSLFTRAIISIWKFRWDSLIMFSMFWFVLLFFRAWSGCCRHLSLEHAMMIFFVSDFADLMSCLHDFFNKLSSRWFSHGVVFLCEVWLPTLRYLWNF